MNKHENDLQDVVYVYKANGEAINTAKLIEAGYVETGHYLRYRVHNRSKGALSKQAHSDLQEYCETRKANALKQGFEMYPTTTTKGEQEMTEQTNVPVQTDDKAKAIKAIMAQGFDFNQALQIYALGNTADVSEDVEDDYYPMGKPEFSGPYDRAKNDIRNAVKAMPKLKNPQRNLDSVNALIDLCKAKDIEIFVVDSRSEDDRTNWDSLVTRLNKAGTGEMSKHFFALLPVMSGFSYAEREGMNHKTLKGWINDMYNAIQTGYLEPKAIAVYCSTRTKRGSLEIQSQFIQAYSVYSN